MSEAPPRSGSSPPRPAHLPWLVVDALVGWLAAWQVLALVAVFVGLSFDVLTGLGFLALGGLLLPLATRPWEAPDRAEAGEAPEPRWWWVALGTAGAAAALAGFGGGHASVGVTSLLALPLAATQVAPRSRAAGPAALPAGPLDAASLVATGIGASVLVTWLCRPDVDDAYYLNEVLQTLLHPELAVLSFDGIHGVAGAPLQQVIHRPQTYEVLIAWLARVSGAEARWVYWVVAPAVVAGLAPVGWWVVARQLAPRVAWLAVPLTMGALVAWGDGPQTLGRFGFPRLFQGKSVFVFVMVAVVVHAALRWVGDPSWRSALRLTAAGLAASLFTSTSLVVAPIAVGLTLLAGLRLDRRGLATFAVGLATTSPLLVTLFLSYLELRVAGGLASDGYTQLDTTSLGTGRSALALVWLAAVPWWMGDRAQRPLVARHVVVSVLIVASGAGPFLLGEAVADLLNWRTFWAIPFGPLMGVGGACALEAGWRAVRGLRPADALRALSFAALAVAFVQAGHLAVEEDGITWRFASYKVKPSSEAVADQVLRYAGPDDVVAAPPHVAQALAQRPDKPPLVGVWTRYVTNLTRFWGKEETTRRNAVLEYARGSKRMELPSAELDALCVRVLVLPRKRIESARAGLLALGFVTVGETAGNVLYTRPEDRLPAGCR